MKEIPLLDLKLFRKNRILSFSERENRNSWDILMNIMQFYCTSCEKQEYNISKIAEKFRSKSVFQLPLPVCIHLSSYFWNKSTVEELYKKIEKVLQETRLWESMWRYFLWLLGQINVIFLFLARNTVEPHYFYWNIRWITIFTPGDRKTTIFFSIFSNLAEGFRSNAVILLPLPVCIYLSSFFWNKSDDWRIIQKNL